MYVQPSPNYRGALRMQRACSMAVWRIAPLTMARCAHDLRRALDANAKKRRMRNRVTVHVRVAMFGVLRSEGAVMLSYN